LTPAVVPLPNWGSVFSAGIKRGGCYGVCASTN